MNNNLHVSIFFFAIILFCSCGKYITETGNASYYGDQFVHRRMANGKTFSQHKLTAAHKTLPLGTKVKVINLTNHKRVKVRITNELTSCWIRRCTL